VSGESIKTKRRHSLLKKAFSFAIRAQNPKYSKVNPIDETDIEQRTCTL